MAIDYPGGISRMVSGLDSVGRVYFSGISELLIRHKTIAKPKDMSHLSGLCSLGWKAQGVEGPAVAFCIAIQSCRINIIAVAVNHREQPKSRTGNDHLFGDEPTSGKNSSLPHR